MKVRKFAWINLVSTDIPTQIIESFIEGEKKVAGNRLRAELPDVEILDTTSTFEANLIRGGEIHTIVKFFSKSLDFAEKYLREQIERELQK